MKDDRLINLNAVLDTLNGIKITKGANWYEYYQKALKAVGELPSAQPEIIRCKDCKYNPNPPECGNAACVLFYGMTDQMGFCHHGERREQE